MSPSGEAMGEERKTVHGGRGGGAGIPAAGGTLTARSVRAGSEEAGKGR